MASKRMLFLMLLVSFVTMSIAQNCVVKIAKNKTEEGVVLVISTEPTDGRIESVRWNSGQDGEKLLVKENGKFCVRVKFISGCVAEKCVEVNEFPTTQPCIAEIKRKTDTLGNVYLCAEAKGGRIIKYRWSSGDTSQCVRIPENESKLCVAVGFDGGCIAEDCIELPKPCRVEIERKVDDNGNVILCAITASSDDLRKFYWTTGDTTSCIRWKGDAREVCVKVLFAGGCIASDCIQMPENECKATIVRRTDNSGNTYLCVETKGNDVKRYKWSTGDSTHCIKVPENMEKVCIAVSFAGGCVAEDCIELPSNCRVEIVRKTDDNGNIYLCAISPNAGSVAAYYWSTGDSTSCIRVNGDAKEICVKVVFNNKCLATDCVKIEPQECRANIVRRVDSNGNAILCLETKGNNVLKYRWSTGDTTSCIRIPSELKKVCVQVFFEGGCNAEDCFELGEECSVKIERSSVSPQVLGLCAIVKANAVTYSWSTGSNDACIKVDKNGEYCVKAIYSNGCIATDCIKIDYFKDEDSCRFAIEKRRTDDGILLTLFTKPTGIKALTWSTGEETESILVKENGEYCVKAILENGCSGAACVKISSFDCGVVIVQREKILVARAQGKGEIKYYWTTGDTTKRIEINEPGKYCVKIVDAIGCIKETCVEVTAKGMTKSTPTETSNLNAVELDQSNVDRNLGAIKNLTSLYPNPFTESFVIDLSELKDGIQLIEIFAINGAKIYERKFDQDKIEQVLSVDIADSKPGVYVVKIRSGNQQFVSKLIKY